MAASQKVYSRLTRNVMGFGTVSNLWLATDHLLLVRSSGYNEDYTRFQLRDIKAIFVVSSSRRLYWGITWGSLAAIFGVFAVASLVRGGFPVVSWIVFAFCFGFFVWNHLMGPGCDVQLVTGVQTARLPALVRSNKARRVVARLQPLIQAAQADLMPAVSSTATSPAPSPETASPTATGSEKSEPSTAASPPTSSVPPAS